MRAAHWDDYELIDASCGERLERWGEVILARPDPQILWDTPREHPLWGQVHARYFRSQTGGGKWQIYREFPPVWKIGYRDLTFRLQCMGFKHTGVFPEQAVNWDFAMEKIGAAVRQGREVRILNLFGYTGAATLACARAGAKVCHVDASKGMVAWAKENAAVSGLSDRPVRWLVDDCMKFVQREQRRGNTYDGIIMDPPSYGRGPAGKYGSSKNSFTAWWIYVCPSCPKRRCFSCSIPTPRGFPRRSWRICLGFCSGPALAGRSLPMKSACRSR